eukprot:Hpha_TRINITY_DN2042_c0_g1::TRINITY_DN2042_c0_g1_i1::g.82858::m.82858
MTGLSPSRRRVGSLETPRTLNALGPRPPTALTTASDGLACVVFRGHLLVHGGAVAGKVWLLSLARRTWSEVQCTGSVPPPRLYHSAVIVPSPPRPGELVPAHDELIVFGGSLMGEGDEAVAPDDKVYALDLGTFAWRIVATRGSAPQARSHHTAVNINGRVIMFGGRSTRHSREPTAEELREDKKSGFFDVYSLDTVQGEWARVDRYDPQAPMLWAHSACTFRHYMIVYGGFDVSGADNHAGAAPQAVMTSTVHIWDSERCKWARATPLPRAPCPVSRALHGAVVCHDKMFVYGGLTVDSNGRALSVQDSWTYDIGSGSWNKIEFAVPHWGGRRPLGAVLENGTDVVVCTDLAEVHYLSFSAVQQGWATEQCDPTALFRRPEEQEPPPPAQPPQPAP